MSSPGPSPDVTLVTRFGDEATAHSVVLAEVTAVIHAVLGSDELVGIEIGLDTSFQEDLEVESIEFVAMSERLIHRYGDQVDFVGWMASMELDEIIALTVGDLVRYVAAPL
ncbi:MAG: acyl carrier protein [Acidimicrobiales bacterium]